MAIAKKSLLALLALLVSSAATGSSWPSNRVSVAEIVTNTFFKFMSGNASSSCAAKNFYTLPVFLNATVSYPEFGTVGSINDSKREIAAFFANVAHETIGFCYIEEINGTSRNYCDDKNTTYPCLSKKGYYGRGPIQLSWNYNYGPAGESIGFDGLTNPEIVAKDSLISFKTALWYWMNNCHNLILSGKGFGATIRAINGKLECKGANSEEVNDRVEYYIKFCKQLRVDPGKNLTC